MCTRTHTCSPFRTRVSTVLLPTLVLAIMLERVLTLIFLLVLMLVLEFKNSQASARRSAKLSKHREDLGLQVVAVCSQIEPFRIQSTA